MKQITDASSHPGDPPLAELLRDAIKRFFGITNDE